MESLRYVVINTVGLAAAIGVVLGLRVRLHWRPLHVVAGAMVILTAVFDNCMVAMRVFEYAPGYMSGWMVGRAPIEDFAYAIAAALLMPAIWERLRQK